MSDDRVNSITSYIRTGISNNVTLETNGKMLRHIVLKRFLSLFCVLLVQVVDYNDQEGLLTLEITHQPRTGYEGTYKFSLIFKIEDGRYYLKAGQETVILEEISRFPGARIESDQTLDRAALEYTDKSRVHPEPLARFGKEA